MGSTRHHLVWQTVELDKNANPKYETTHPTTGEIIPMPSMLYDLWVWAERIRGDIAEVEHSVEMMQLELVRLAGARWDKKNS
jgi:hypothetical protein